MSEPVRKAWSQEELREAALEFMRVDFGLPERGDQEARARWYERVGLIVSFTTWMWDCYPASGASLAAPGFCPECLMTGGHKLSCGARMRPVDEGKT